MVLASFLYPVFLQENSSISICFFRHERKMNCIEVKILQRFLKKIASTEANTMLPAVKAGE